MVPDLVHGDLHTQFTIDFLRSQELAPTKAPLIKKENFLCTFFKETDWLTLFFETFDWLTKLGNLNVTKLGDRNVNQTLEETFSRYPNLIVET